MDIFAHSVYAGILGKTIEKNDSRRKKTMWLTALFGVVPDLFAFGPVFIVSIFNGGFNHHVLPSGFDLAHTLYQYSHSLVIAVTVLMLVFLFKKIWWTPLFGWILHILIDMPLHAPDFFPTPFLFPISSWTLPFGISWATPAIFFTTWGLVVAYVIWYWYNRNYNNKMF